MGCHISHEPPLTLMQACEANDVAAVKTAVRAGASVNRAYNDSDGSPCLPLESAVQIRGHPVSTTAATVSYLLSAGADPNGGTTMYYSGQHCAPRVLQLLLDAGGPRHCLTASDTPAERVVLAVEGCAAPPSVADGPTKYGHQDTGAKHCRRR